MPTGYSDNQLGLDDNTVKTNVGDQKVILKAVGDFNDPVDVVVLFRKRFR
ncbi:MAG: hypothetical protein ACNYWM_04695 [Methanosarcinales archaeon]